LAAWKENDYLLLQPQGKGRKKQNDSYVGKWMQKPTRFIAISQAAIANLEREYEEIQREAENNPINTDNIIEAEEQFKQGSGGAQTSSNKATDKPPNKATTNTEYRFPSSWDDL